MSSAIDQIGPDDAEQLVAQGAFLLDVREDDEWRAGHAPAATHLPLSQVPDGHAGLLPRDNRVIAVCRAGARSQQAAEFLQQAGYDVVNLAGGMQAWAAAGKDVVTDAGEPGRVV